MEDLERLLGESDVVTVCLPLTDETRDRIGERELNAMKRNAYLINISRGAVINEDSLIAALRDGTIAGAGLDVFHTHPLPPGSPLWEMPQVIVTPYISAASPHTMTRAMEIFADNLLRYSSGVPLRNVVNMKRGY
jgi:phosphoglycerate dehydrogenase-like enzyme